MEIRVNPFSIESIDNALALLSTFTESTLDKVDELIALMVEEGEYVALAKCLPAESGETSDSILSESKVTGLRHNRYGYIIAGGAAIWLEFGTGVYYPDNYPGEKPSGIVAHGEYGKKENKGSTGDPWFYYDEKQGRFRITRGLPARAFMWQTATHLRNHFPELARKVWKG
jgi:hypothetical protein